MNYDIDYIKSLISNKSEESLNLEYKAANALDRQNNKTTEISKDVSAFANSDGGIIIYGMKEDELNRHIPKEIEPVNRNEFSKEWLEQVINDKIKPRLTDFKIYPIEISLTEVVYLIEIQKSNTAHQADDKRYYKRYNFQSVPMYDFEIRDILNRSKNPKLTLAYEFDNSHSTLLIYAENSGAVYANYVNLILRAPKKIIKGDHYKSINHSTIEIYAENTIRDILDTQYLGPEFITHKYGPSRFDPILPKRRVKLIELKLINFPFDPEHLLEYEIYCDNCEPVIGRFALHELLNK